MKLLGLFITGMLLVGCGAGPEFTTDADKPHLTTSQALDLIKSLNPTKSVECTFPGKGPNEPAWSDHWSLLWSGTGNGIDNFRDQINESGLTSDEMFDHTEITDTTTGKEVPFIRGSAESANVAVFPMTEDECTNPPPYMWQYKD